MAESNKKIVGFKKFSEQILNKSKIKEVDTSNVDNTDDSDITNIPNLPNNLTKKEKAASRKNLIPEDQEILSKDNDEYINDINMKDKTHENKVETIGKVAKFPKNTKASKAFSYLENVKVSKKSIWYIMVERESNELQMIKYNYMEGVDLSKFITELKTYYTNKYKDNQKICESINKIKIDGNDKYSMITSIPLIEVDGVKLIAKITEDLIKLLSK
jgi:hypothetical protein